MEEEFKISESSMEEPRPTVKKSTAEKHRRETYKTEICKVLLYNKSTKELDINFKGYGIRVFHVQDTPASDYVTIKYRGEIGKPNFTYEL